MVNFLLCWLFNDGVIHRAIKRHKHSHQHIHTKVRKTSCTTSTILKRYLKSCSGFQVGTHTMHTHTAKAPANTAGSEELLERQLHACGHMLMWKENIHETTATLCLYSPSPHSVITLCCFNKPLLVHTVLYCCHSKFTTGYCRLCHVLLI